MQLYKANDNKPRQPRLRRLKTTTDTESVVLSRLMELRHVGKEPSDIKLAVDLGMRVAYVRRALGSMQSRGLVECSNRRWKALTDHYGRPVGPVRVGRTPQGKPIYYCPAGVAAGYGIQRGPLIDESGA